MNATPITDRIVRIVTVCIGIFLPIMVAIFTFLATKDGNITEWFPILIWCVLICLIYLCCGLVPRPIVKLSEKGVTVRVLLCSRYYGWQELKQAGILSRMSKWRLYDQMIFVKPNGSCRRYKDDTFRIRNVGRLICFRVTEESKEYVIRHYGPLDFDLPVGKEEL